MDLRGLRSPIARLDCDARSELNNAGVMGVPAQSSFGHGDPNDPQVSVVGHELETFVRQASEQLRSEYVRISRRAREDPGTAGDEGEENWRALLAAWLPIDFHVTTKGRILALDGRLSPQVDVVVLRPGYPPALRDKKVHLAGGVFAAFECKLTLTAAHIAAAGSTSREIASIAGPRSGTPYDELHSPILYGLLAHGARAGRDPLARLDAALAGELALDAHPREGLDVTCVANLGCWRSWTVLISRARALPADMWAKQRELYELDPEGSVHRTYARWMTIPWRSPDPPADPLYLLITHLYGRIGREYPLYRSIAGYWTSLAVSGTNGQSIASRSWPFSILSDDVKERVQSRGGEMGDRWSPWSTSD